MVQKKPAAKVPAKAAPAKVPAKPAPKTAAQQAAPVVNSQQDQSSFDLSSLPEELHASATAALKSGASKPGIEQAIIAKIKSEYGYASWALKIPDIKNVLVVGSIAGWDQNTMLGALTNTSWWKQNNANQRSWAQMQGQDPAGAHQLIAESQAKITETAGRLGVPLSARQINQMAHQVASQSATPQGALATNSGMTNEQIDEMVASAYKGPADQSKGPAGGEAATLYDNFAKIAGNYMIQVSPAALNQWVSKTLAGYTEQGGFEAGATSAFENYAKGVAKGAFPTLAAQIDQGNDVKTLLDPYVQHAASTLKVDPNVIDFTQPGWSNVLNRIDPTSGQKSMMTLDQMDSYIKSTPMSVGGQTVDYSQSEEAKGQMSDIMATIGKAFGKAA